MVKVVGQQSVVSIVGDSRKTKIDPLIIFEGKDGKDGAQGPQGIQGVPGKDGLDGKNGQDGKDGKDGRDGRDGVDGKDGVSFWIEFDKKKNTLVFKNNGGLKNPESIKLPKDAGWGYGIGRGGGSAVQADWNQTDPHAVDYIKNKPQAGGLSFEVVDELPAVGRSDVIYLVPVDGPQEHNIYEEFIWVKHKDGTYGYEKLGTTEIDLTHYVKDDRTVNGQALSADVELTAEDIDATVSSITETIQEHLQTLKNDVGDLGDDVSDLQTNKQDVQITISGITDTVTDHIQTLKNDIGDLGDDISDLQQGKQDKLTSVNAGTNITITQSGGVAKINADTQETKRSIITLSGDSGSLSAAQIAIVSDNAKLYLLINDGEVYNLVNTASNLTYKTFINIDAAITSNAVMKVLYIQLDSGAANYGRWSKEEVFVDAYTKTESDGRFATSTQGSKADTAVQPSGLTSAINTHNSSGTAHSDIRSLIATINSYILSDTTATNQLVNKSFVNSSIASNTATFIGTFNSVAELEAYAGTKTPNDYAFVKTTDASGNTIFNRYKWTGTAWLYEYSLNNSSFTAAQWEAINSTITTAKVTSYESHISNANIHVTVAEKEGWDAKQDAIGDLATIRSGAAAGATALQSGDSVSELTNDAGYITGINASMVITAMGYTPVDPDDLHMVAYSGMYSDLVGTPSIPEDISDLGDVEINNPQEDQVLKYNGTKWINSTGGGSAYTAGFGIDITNNVISVKDVFDCGSITGDVGSSFDMGTIV